MEGGATCWQHKAAKTGIAPGTENRTPVRFSGLRGASLAIAAEDRIVRGCKVPLTDKVPCAKIYIGGNPVNRALTGAFAETRFATVKMPLYSQS